MKKLALALSVIAAVGCAKPADEKKEDPKPPPTIESKTVTARTDFLRAEVAALKNSAPSIRKETTCFRLGRLSRFTSVFLNDVNNVIADEANLDQIRVAFETLDAQSFRLNGHCRWVPKSDVMAAKYEKQMVDNLDTYSVAIDAMSALGKQGVIKELKPLNSEATQTEIQAGKYPAQWYLQADMLAVKASFISGHLAFVSSGQSCFEMSNYAEEARRLSAVLNSYQMPTSIALSAALLEGSVKGLTDFCASLNETQKQFATIMPEVRRSLRDSSDQATKLADLLKIN